jgi:hypothetical protein
MSQPTIANLIVVGIDKNGVDKTSLQKIFESDSDFSENKDSFRPDTLKKGFKNEAERVSAEIFNKCKKIEEESERVEAMMKKVFEVENFIGNSSYYGSYRYAITETEFEYIVSIAYTT